MISNGSNGSADEPKVPSWVIDLLEKSFPLKDVLKAQTERELHFHKGNQHVIEFLRVRSENP